jgi:hypothetical protein
MRIDERDIGVNLSEKGLPQIYFRSFQKRSEAEFLD